MRFLVAFLVLIAIQAMSLKDFNARPATDRSAYVADFVAAAMASTQNSPKPVKPPPMIVHNPDGTFTVQKQPPEPAKDTKAKKRLVIPPQVIVPFIPPPAR